MTMPRTPDEMGHGAAPVDTHLHAQAEVPPSIAHLLSHLDIQHTYQLLSANNASREHLQQYLRVDDQTMDALIDGVRRSTPDRVVTTTREVVPEAERRFGALTPSAAMQAEATALPIAGSAEVGVTLPTTVSLIAEMPPIRDQGTRGTCVAFAETALHEFAEGGRRDYSERDLYRQAKSLDGIPGACGTYLKAAALALVTGQLLEADCAYDRAAACDDHGLEPGATTRYPLTLVQLQSGDIVGMKALLAEGKPIAFSIPVYGAFITGDTRLTGRVIMPIDGEQNIGGHAMCIVGYVDDGPGNTTPTPGGGYFIIRNSWGTDHWGGECRYGAGYGTIPYAYIARYAWEAYTLAAAPTHDHGNDGIVTSECSDRTATSPADRAVRDTGVDALDADAVRVEIRSSEIVIRISERALRFRSESARMDVKLAAVAPPIPLVSVKADARSGAEPSWQIRSDFAESFRRICGRIRALGAPAHSSGGIRDLNAPVTPGRSRTSLHYTGRAIDVFLQAGMRRLTDPYIVVRDRGTDANPTWRLFGVSVAPKLDDPMYDPSLLTTGTLQCALWTGTGKDQGYVVRPRECTYFSITDLMVAEGWVPISSRTTWKTTYESLEWWHFQNEKDLEQGVTTFGAELKQVWQSDLVDASGLALAAVWTQHSFQSS